VNEAKTTVSFLPSSHSSSWVQNGRVGTDH
jgi:hypothetical protein